MQSICNICFIACMLKVFTLSPKKRLWSSLLKPGHFLTLAEVVRVTQCQNHWLGEMNWKGGEIIVEPFATLRVVWPLPLSLLLGNNKTTAFLSPSLSLSRKHTHSFSHSHTLSLSIPYTHTHGVSFSFFHNHSYTQTFSSQASVIFIEDEPNGYNYASKTT